MWQSFGEEREALWRKIIKAKYGESNGHWSIEVVDHGNGSHIWGDISTFEEGHAVKVRESSKWVIGDGFKIYFWEDLWVGEEPLDLSIPKLYSLPIRKHELIKDLCKGY